MNQLRVAHLSILRNFNLLGNPNDQTAEIQSQCQGQYLPRNTLQNRGNRQCRHCRRRSQRNTGPLGVFWLVGWEKLGAKHVCGVDFFFLFFYYYLETQSWPSICGPCFLCSNMRPRLETPRGKKWFVGKSYIANGFVGKSYIAKSKGVHTGVRLVVLDYKSYWIIILLE